jgi:hypothetical protein
MRILVGILVFLAGCGDEKKGSIDKNAALSILHDVLDRKPISEEQIQMVIATTRLTEPEIRELIAIRKEVRALSAKTDEAARKRRDEIGQRTIQLMNKASSH